MWIFFLLFSLNSLTLFCITFRTLSPSPWQFFVFSSIRERKFFRYISLSLSLAFLLFSSYIRTYTRQSKREAFRHEFLAIFFLSHSLSCSALRVVSEMFNSIIHSHSGRVSRNIRVKGEKKVYFFYYFFISFLFASKGGMKKKVEIRQQKSKNARVRVLLA
jgi:hypothetical protein